MKQLCYYTGLALLSALSLTACASRGPAVTATAPAAPRFPAYPMPDIPAALNVPTSVRTRHDEAWQRLQAGDLSGATEAWGAVLDDAPGLYPAETGIGFAELADGDYQTASARFASALIADEAYLPAWMGQAEALLGLERDLEAIEAMERVLALDPSRTTVRTRLDLVRFRLTQSSIEAGREARAAGRHDEAIDHLARALTQSPESPVILGELARAELGAGHLEDAEAHARQAAAVEPTTGQWHALVGEVLEVRGEFAGAADAYERGAGLDRNEEWRTRARTLRDRAEIATLPEHFRTITSAPTVTRADVAAYVGIHLRELVDRAPSRAATVATDVRSHWAAPWILTMTRTGIMPVFLNHTFQPAGVVRRGDLAAVAAELVQLVGGQRPAQLRQWQAARPDFADLPTGNLFYAAAALATSAGVMQPDASGRFAPTRPATGAELQAVVDRIAVLGQP